MPKHDDPKSRARSNIAIILEKESLYRDGPPNWREGRTRRRCQTAVEAKRERNRLRKRLLRFGRGNKAAEALAGVLDFCAPNARCHSGACPECGRAFQRALVSAGSDFLVRENGQVGQRSTVLSLIHCSGAVAPGKLDDEVLVALRHFYSTALRSAGIEVAVCGFDLSFNEDRQGSFQPHWLIHLHGHVPEEVSEAAVIHLRKLFPPCACRGISRPVQVTDFNGNLAGHAYAHKPGVTRRQGYLQSKETAGGSRTCRNTRGRPLTGQQAVEAALFLHRIGLTRRVLLHGWRLARRSDGSVVMMRQS